MLKVAGLFLCLLLVLAGTFPFWWLPALGAAAAKYGVSWDSSERKGLSRFVLHNAHGSSGNFHWSAKTIEGFSPPVWLWKARHRATNAVYLQINGWKAVQATNAPASGPFTTNSLPQVADLTRNFEPQLEKVREWLPRAELLNGLYEKGDQVLRCGLITWNAGRLSADLNWGDNPSLISVQGSLEKPPYTVGAYIAALSLRTRFQITPAMGGVVVSNRTIWQDVTATSSAEYASGEKLPHAASVRSREFKLPAELLKLRGYDYVTGNLDATWGSNRFAGNLIATSEGGQEGRQLAVNVAAEGDLQEVQLKKASLTSPGIQVALKAPSRWDYRGHLLDATNAIALAVDLSEQSWIKGTGSVTGEIKLTGRTTDYPYVDLDLRGENFRYQKVALDTATLQGRLDWPRLRNFQLRGGSKDLSLNVRGEMNVPRREISAGELAIKTAAFSLSSNISWGSLTLTGQVAGPLTNLGYSGAFAAGALDTKWTVPLQVAGQVRGFGTNLQRLSLSLTNETIAAGLSGAFLPGPGMRLELGPRQLYCRIGGAETLSLQERAVLEFHPGTREVLCSNLVLKGSAGSAKVNGDVQWPGRGNAEVKVEGFTLAALKSVLRPGTPLIEIPRLDASLGWSNSPLAGAFRLQSKLPLATNLVLEAEAAGKLDQAGLALDKFDVADRNGLIARIAGQLPMQITTTNLGGFLRGATRRQMRVRAELGTNDAFWDQLTSAKGFYVRQPRMILELGGPAINPTGTVRIAAQALNFPNKKQMPALTNLQARLLVAEKKVRAAPMTGYLEGEPFRLEGAWQVPETLVGVSFAELKRSLITNSAGRFTAGPAPLAPFAEFAPRFLAPEGRWKVDLEVAPGARLSGDLELSGLSSRPLPPLAPLRDINTRLKLRERSIRFEGFSATLGGEALRLSGGIDLPKDMAVRAAFPAMDLHLSGTNLPLARQPELVLRGDLDLFITNSLGGIPLIGGEVTLKESYYLNEIKALVPGRLAKAKRRPPYFSIEQAPFDEWKLNLRVHGDHSLKIRSPLFRGVASAAFTLEGTLSEPFAFGEATLNEGTVQFPFANVRINQGLVTLARDDPFRPKVLASGTSRTFGYDIKMDVQGPADEPGITFTSTPGLTTEQIILMLTTGEIPQSEQLFSNQQRAGKLAMFLGKSLWSKFSGGEGGAERLTIRSGEEISEQGKQTYQVEYKLTDVWALVGEYDRFGSINAGLKWKLYSR